MSPPPQFKRTHIPLGDAGLARLAQAHALVAGLADAVVKAIPSRG